MPKSPSYHEAAIYYNEQLAIAAEALTETVADPTVKSWTESVAKQHRYHETRHRRLLKRAQEQPELPFEDVPTPVSENLEVKEEAGV